MVKSIGMIVIALSIGAPVFAQESHFLKLGTKCEVEAHEGPDGTPQSPPLNIDDPETPGCNKWEINVTFDNDLSKGERHLEVPLVDVNYGIGDNLQLKYEIPQVRDEMGNTAVSGWGNAKLGVKYLFYENESEKLKLAFYPQVEKNGPKAATDNIVSLPFLLSKKIGDAPHGDVMLTVNMGYNIAHSTSAKDFISFATGLGAPISSKLALMGEIATEQATSQLLDEKREEIVKANIAIMGSINSSFSMYGSLGASLISSDQKQHQYALTGVRWNPQSF